MQQDAYRVPTNVDKKFPKIDLKIPKITQKIPGLALSILCPNLFFIPFSSYLRFHQPLFRSMVYCTFADVNNLLVLSPWLFQPDFNGKNYC